MKVSLITVSQRTVLRRLATLLLLGVSVAGTAAQDKADSGNAPAAPQPDDPRIMVITVDAELRSGSTLVGKAALAEILTGKDVNGEWLWIPDAKGWIQ